MTTRGQVTIPVEIRRHLGLTGRDKIAFVVDQDGTVRLAAPRDPDIDSLRGTAGSLGSPLPWERVEEIAREDREDRLARKLGIDPSS